MQTITLPNGRTLGDFLPPFIAAEVGINHNGDMDLAKEMIRAAAKTGACSVKFQNYRTEDFISDHSLTHSYISQGKEVVESQYTMFKRCELSASDLKDLRAEADREGIIFFTTPTSRDTVRDAVEAGVAVLKNGSDYLGNLPLIRIMAQTGLPTILSTGMASLSEIEDAVTAFHGAGGRELILLHCVSSYPAPAKDVNLNKMVSMRNAFGVPTGFSDHTEGIAAAVASVALGSCMIEKHFTTDRNLPGPDHRFSSNPEEMKELAISAKKTQLCLGSGVLQPTPDESRNRMEWKLSCLAGKDLSAGHVLVSNDIILGRPGIGYSPKMLDDLVGRPLTRAVKFGQVLKHSDFV